MLVAVRLKHIVEHELGKRRYLDMSKLEEMDVLRGKVEG
jgi:putative transposase